VVGAALYSGLFNCFTELSGCFWLVRDATLFLESYDSGLCYFSLHSLSKSKGWGL